MLVFIAKLAAKPSESADGGTVYTQTLCTVDQSWDLTIDCEFVTRTVIDLTVIIRVIKFEVYTVSLVCRLSGPVAYYARLQARPKSRPTKPTLTRAFTKQGQINIQAIRIIPTLPSLSCIHKTIGASKYISRLL